jgi:hypothetical protein
VSRRLFDIRWRAGVLDIEHESGSGVGARYRQGVKGPGGRRVAADIEITEYEPERLIGFRATTGPVRPHGRYTLGADGADVRLRRLDSRHAFRASAGVPATAARSPAQEVVCSARVDQTPGSCASRAPAWTSPFS